MKRPTTIRIDDKLLKEITRFAKKMKQDKAQYIRFLLSKGFAEDKKDRVLALYAQRKLSMEEARNELGMSVWDFLNLLQEKNHRLNVQLEDWLDAKEV